jgi:hypothetical protein
MLFNLCILYNNSAKLIYEKFKNKLTRMEEKNRHTGLKQGRNTFLKEIPDIVEILNPIPRDKRKTVSAAKLRSIISRNAPSTPIEGGKSSALIQKQLDKLCSIQTSLNSEKRNSEGNINSRSKPKPFSSNKSRKGMTYKRLSQNSSEKIEIDPIAQCPNCKLYWGGTNKENLCEVCNKDIKGLAFRVELKFFNENCDKALLVIGQKEFIINTTDKFKCIVNISQANIKKISDAGKGLDINTDGDWKTDYSHITTPSFHRNS